MTEDEEIGKSRFLEGDIHATAAMSGHLAAPEPGLLPPNPLAHWLAERERMTYCTVAQVGNVRFGKAKAEGSIEHVLRAAELLDLFLGFKGLYDPSSTWDHSPIDIGFEADGQIIVPLRYWCISVSQIQRYSSSYTLLDTISPALSDHYANTYLARADSGFQSGDGLKVTGVRGHARLKALDADDEVAGGAIGVTRWRGCDIRGRRRGYRR